MVVVFLKNVSKSFGTGTHATHVLKNIDLTVEEGEVLVCSPSPAPARRGSST